MWDASFQNSRIPMALTRAFRILDLPSLLGPTRTVSSERSNFLAAIMLRKFSTVNDTRRIGLLRYNARSAWHRRRCSGRRFSVRGYSIRWALPLQVNSWAGRVGKAARYGYKVTVDENALLQGM